MTALCTVLVSAALAFAIYTYVGYPLLLWMLPRWGGGRHQGPGRDAPDDWPNITILLPAYNEESVIRRTIENLLQLDYPEDRRRIVVLSDASTDGTDAIVGEYVAQGVTLLRMPQRGGKTAAENAALPLLRDEIIVNTDASVLVERGALKALIRHFADASVGVASSHNVSVARMTEQANYAESWYVGYDMWVRGLETRAGGIVGAAGCLYAARACVQRKILPNELSRDFAAALLAREQGLRAVSAREAICFVPRIASLRREYHRKVRTITRGIETLYFKRALLNPFRHGAFSWVLASHKVCRWLIPHAAVVAFAALLCAPQTVASRLAIGVALATTACALLAWWWPERRALPRLVAVPAYFAIGNLAALHASLRVLGRDQDPVWEPTRRETVFISPRS